MPIINIAWAGIKKRKVYSIAIFLLVFIIGALSNIGITMMQRISEIYDEMHKKTNSVHVQYLFDVAFGEKVMDFEQWFQMDDRIKEVKVTKTLILRNEAFNFNGKNRVELPISLYPNIEKK